MQAFISTRTPGGRYRGIAAIQVAYIRAKHSGIWLFNKRRLCETVSLMEEQEICCDGLRCSFLIYMKNRNSAVVTWP